MKSIESLRLIDAPLELVFGVISNPEQFARAVPQVQKVEFLTDHHSGVGTRFRETRGSEGREQTIELEIKERALNDRIRIVSEAGGAVWDTLFTVRQTGAGVELSMRMDVQPKNIFARMMNSMIHGLVVKGVEADMDAVKAYCEQSANE